MTEEEYLVLQCPACEKDVKLPSDSFGQRMGCPYCMQPLEVAEAEPEEAPEAPPEEEQPKAPIERRPLVFRELRDDDVAEVSTLEFADEHTRRRLPFEAPEWDVAKEGGSRDDPEDSQGSEAAVLTGSDGKQLLTRREQNFRTVTIILMSLALLSAGTITCLAIFGTVGIFGKEKKNKEVVNISVQEDKANAAAAKEEVTIHLLSGEEKAAVEVVNGFLNAQTNEERLKYVRNPERIGPLMEEWYASGEARSEWPDGQAILRDKIQDQGRYFVRLAIEFAGLGSRIFVVEQQSKDRFKLDWETAVGYQPQPLSEFKSKQLRTPTEFRVKVKKSDYYNYHFIDRTKYFAVELAYPGREFSLIGYVDRSRAWAPGLIKQIAEGIQPSLIVQLKYPDDELKNDSQVEILSIVSQTWLL